MKKWIGIFAVLFGSSIAMADSPRVRQTMDWGWKFYLGDKTEASGIKFDDSAWKTVDLPHDFSISQDFAQNAPAAGAGGYLPTGVGWYRKSFTVPDTYRSKHVAIQFDGVYENSEVWLNGHSLGRRPFGYIGFEYDMTPYLNFGGDNLLAVRADNSLQPNSRWYSGSGIDRHTWLVVTDPLHIPYSGIYITTPQAEKDSADVKVVAQVENDGADMAKYQVKSTVIDAEGNAVGEVEVDGQADGHGTAEANETIKIANPHLWSVDAPYLYSVRTEVVANGKTVDQYDSTIGIRTIKFDVDKGFLLNGQHVKLNGVCVHEDCGSVGAAVPEGVWERRLKLLKEMGCNAIRTSHNPPTPEFLDLCDKLGFCVMDESFDEWEGGKVRNGYHLFFKDWSQRDLTDFIERDRNHPCVVLWSCGNEIGEQTAANGIAILKPLVDTIHALDPTRPVTAACDKVYAEPRSAPPAFLALLDVVGYNYVDRWRARAQIYYSDDRRDFPNRLFVGTESSSMGGTRGDYSYIFNTPPTTIPTPLPMTLPTTGPAARGRRGGFGMGAGGFGRASTSRRIDVEQLWKFVGAHDYVTGDFMWTGIDYIGESGWPAKNATSGVLDTCGFPKDGYYFYQSQWTDKPVLHGFPHWNWAGKEGQIVPVTCYTNCDTVELFVNGKSFGVKGYEFPRQGMEQNYGFQPERARAARTTSDLHLSWDVPYEPGTIKFVGTRNNQTVATEEISTTGAPSAVKLDIDKTQLAADGRDVMHITAQIVDEHGRTVPTADNEITFKIDGAATLIGTDAGNPVSHENYKSNVRKAFNGLALAIIQSQRTGGAIHISAKSPGLTAATADGAAK